MDIYNVYKKDFWLKVNKFINKPIFSTTQVTHVSIFMWGKDIGKYVFYKNGKLINTENLIGKAWMVDNSNLDELERLLKLK